MLPSAVWHKIFTIKTENNNNKMKQYRIHSPQATAGRPKEQINKIKYVGLNILFAAKVDIKVDRDQARGRKVRNLKLDHTSKAIFFFM